MRYAATPLALVALLVPLADGGCEPSTSGREGPAQGAVTTMPAGQTIRVTDLYERTWRAPHENNCRWKKRKKDSDMTEEGTTAVVTLTGQDFDFWSDGRCGTWRAPRRK